jgi:sulfur carrier protein ThiS
MNETSEKIIRGLELTYKKMIEFKKSKNSPVVVSQNGKVVELDPNTAPPTVVYQ